MDATPMIDALMDQTPAVAPTDVAPMLEARDISKYFGAVVALEGVSLTVRAGQVTCLLGDNGAGKSTLIKTLSGVYRPDKGTLAVDGQPVEFGSPRDALDAGIATVYQDLSVMPLMSITRNFFLGNEPTKGRGILQRMDIKTAQAIMRDEMAKMGIDVRDPDQTVGTLSGGERQAMSIARAVYFGAKVLILDEPTSALGVKQSGIVLKYVIQARAQGRGVIFISHNPHHAFPVGDRFVLLKRGQMMGSYLKSQTTLEQLTSLMAGGAELEQLSHELQGLATDPEVASDPGLAEVAKEMAAEVKETA